MRLLGELSRQAKKALEQAQERYESAGSMERHRLLAVIRERRRAVQLLEHVRLGIKYGQITQQDTAPRRKRCRG